MPLQRGGDFGPRLVVFHAGGVRIGLAENAAAGVDPGDARTGGFGEPVKSLLLLGQHERDGSGFFGKLLAELVCERLLYALGDKIIDGDERKGENRHQAQDELTEDARGQDPLLHLGHYDHVNRGRAAALTAPMA